MVPTNFYKLVNMLMMGAVFIFVLVVFSVLYLTLVFKHDLTFDEKEKKKYEQKNIQDRRCRQCGGMCINKQKVTTQPVKLNNYSDENPLLKTPIHNTLIEQQEVKVEISDLHKAHTYQNDFNNYSSSADQLNYENYEHNKQIVSHSTDHNLSNLGIVNTASVAVQSPPDRNCQNLNLSQHTPQFHRVYVHNSNYFTNDQTLSPVVEKNTSVELMTKSIQLTANSSISSSHNADPCLFDTQHQLSDPTSAMHSIA